MNKIALKQVHVTLPTDVPESVRTSMWHIERVIRENNNLLQDAVNALYEEAAYLRQMISDVADEDIEIVKGTQTQATGSWTGKSKQSALRDGMRILYRLPYAGSGNASLNLTLASGMQTGAKPVYRYGTTYVTTQYVAGSLVPMTYLADEGAWIVDGDYSVTNSNTIPSAYCTTSASTAAKTASMTYFSLHTNEWIFINFRYANTKKAAITLDINSTGVKPLYINGSASSASNYSFPAGSYLIFYDGTNYYLRTDGLLPQAST